jgi:poly-beta-hydroxyalkanoate depolymerase
MIEQEHLQVHVRTLTDTKKPALTYIEREAQRVNLLGQTAASLLIILGAGTRTGSDSTGYHFEYMMNDEIYRAEIQSRIMNLVRKIDRTKRKKS